MSEQNAGAAPQTELFKTNKGIGIILTVLGGILLAYLLSSDWVYEKLRDGFHLGLFTVISAITMIICSVAGLGHGRDLYCRLLRLFSIGLEYRFSVGIAGFPRRRYVCLRCSSGSLGDYLGPDHDGRDLYRVPADRHQTSFPHIWFLNHGSRSF